MVRVMEIARDTLTLYLTSNVNIYIRQLFNGDYLNNWVRILEKINSNILLTVDS
jgi:hypothetical protein